MRVSLPKSEPQRAEPLRPPGLHEAQCCPLVPSLLQPTVGCKETSWGHWNLWLLLKGGPCLRGDHEAPVLTEISAVGLGKRGNHSRVSLTCHSVWVSSQWPGRADLWSLHLKAFFFNHTRNATIGLQKHHATSIRWTQVGCRFPAHGVILHCP